MSRLPRRMIEELEDGSARRMLESAMLEVPPRARVLAAYDGAFPGGVLAVEAARAKWPRRLMITGALVVSLTFGGERGAASPSASPSEAIPSERADAPIATDSTPPTSVAAEPRESAPAPPPLPAARALRGVSVDDLPDAPRLRPPVVAKQEPADLLREANRLRAASRWEEAATTYGTLLERSPGSAEAYPALVALGDVELVRGRADAALAAYDRAVAYAPHGMLAEEARWGRVRSYRSLARTAEERAALREFCDLYTDTPLGQLAASRLAQLTP